LKEHTQVLPLYIRDVVLKGRNVALYKRDVALKRAHPTLALLHKRCSTERKK